MVDYVQLISRAVATLNPNTREARQALYQRARQTLVDKLRSIDPTFSHTDLKAERAALESAIQQVERDAMHRTAPPPQRQSAQERAQLPTKDSHQKSDPGPVQNQDGGNATGERNRRRTLTTTQSVPDKGASYEGTSHPECCSIGPVGRGVRNPLAGRKDQQTG